MDHLARFLIGCHSRGSFDYVLQRFIKHKLDDGVSRHTAARLYYSLSPIGQRLDNPPFKTLTAKWLKSYAAGLWSVYAPDSVRTYIADIRQFFKWAKKQGYHRKNIAKRVKQPRQRPRRRKGRHVSEEGILRLMRYLVGCLNATVYRDVFGILQASPSGWDYHQTKLLRDLFIITFLYETGARPGELVNLSAAAMDRATRYPNPTYTLTMFGKTADVDRSFTERTAELWRLWQVVRPAAGAGSAVIGWGNGHKPAPLLTNGISQMIYRRCQEAGVRPFRAGLLRHAKITRARRLVGLETASRLVDHADIRTTRNYDHWTDDELNRATKQTGLQCDFWKNP